VVSFQPPNTVFVSAPPVLPIVTGSPITFTSPVSINQLTVLTDIPANSNRIKNNWTANSGVTGFTEGQTVIQVISINNNTMVLQMSAKPDSPFNAGQAITFTSPGDVKELFVDNISSIIAGYSISGNGYNNQTVVNILNNPDRLVISDHPTGDPLYNLPITFTDNSPITVVPANSTIEFSIDYTQTLNTPTTVNAQMVIDATLAGNAVVKTINNSISISQAPAPPPTTDFNPSGGAGETAPGTVTDGGSSSGSNWEYIIPVLTLIFFGFGW
jgi:hypothetical protein